MWLLPAAVIAAALLVVLVALEPTHLLRALTALIVVSLPSYLIAWPVLQPRLGSAGAFTIAGGLSIGMLAIAGMLLNLLPWGLQAATWLGYVIVLFTIALAFGHRPVSWPLRLPTASHEMVLGGIGGVMMVTALLVARMFAAYPTASFTQLWITPSADAPMSGVELSIRNEEQAATGYRLEVWRNGQLVEAWADIHLAAGETWSDSAGVGSGRIEARLFRLADPGAMYRHVTLQLGSIDQASQRERE